MAWVRIEIDGQVVDELAAPVGMVFGQAVLIDANDGRTSDFQGRTVVVGPIDEPEEAFVVLRFVDGQVTMVRPDGDPTVFGRVWTGNRVLVFSPFEAVVLEAGTTRVMERWSEPSREAAVSTAMLREREWEREGAKVETRIEKIASGRLSEMIEALGPAPPPPVVGSFTP